MKVAINSCYGGFNISDAAYEKYLELKGVTFFKEATDSPFNFINYYSVPVEKYNELYAADKKTGNYSISNGVFLSKSDIERNDPVLIQVIEEMGKESYGPYASLDIIEIPDDVDFVVEEYDGKEWIAETHRTWS